MNRSLISGMIAALFLSACGGGGGGGLIAPASLSGVAVDGYLQGATVFLDVNRNGVQDSNEPGAVTDSQGGYSLDISSLSGQNINGLPIVVTGGVDSDTGYAFAGRLLSPVDSSSTSQVVTPLTTLAEAALSQGLARNVTEARSLVAQGLGLSSGDDLKTNPISRVGSQSEIYIKQVALQRAMQVLTAAEAQTSDSLGFEAQNRIAQAVASAVVTQARTGQGASSVAALVSQVSTAGLSNAAQTEQAKSAAQQLAESTESSVRTAIASLNLTTSTQSQAITSLSTSSGAVLKSIDALRRKVETKVERGGTVNLATLAQEVETEQGRSGIGLIAKSGHSQQEIQSGVSSLISANQSTPSTATQNQAPNINGRLLASNCFQCHATGGQGGFERIRGEAGEIRDYLNKAANSGIMAAHAQGYTDAQLTAIINYFQQ